MRNLLVMLCLTITLSWQSSLLAAPKPPAKQPTKSTVKPGPAEPAAKPEAPKNEKQAQEERFYRALVKGWSLFYGGKLEDAAEAVKAPADSEVEWARVEAQHLQARCYWRAGPQYRGRADLVWKKLQAQSTLNSNLIRLEIAKSLACQAQNRPADSAALLDAALKREIPGTCTPEAAIELGRSYVAQKQWDQAKKAFDFAIGYSQSQAKTNKEIPGYVYDPFIAEAKRALEHVKFDRDEGREEFERAEKLRSDKKYVDAGKAYQAIAKKYPQSHYAPPSELHLGHCLLGLNQPAEAVQHWQKFISAAPSGRWRGQAYTEIINLCLQQVFDLENAARFAQLAQNSLGSALQDPSAAGSWQAGMFDLQLALGMVAFVRGDTAAAADAFSKAAPAAPKDVKKSFPALVAAAKAGTPLLPADVMASGLGTSPPVGGNQGGLDGGKEGGVSDPPPSEGGKQGGVSSSRTLALAMGRIYRITGEQDDSRRMFALAISGKLGRPSAAQFAYAKFATGDALDATTPVTAANKAAARDQYVESLKAFPRGSWQDETLFRIARYIQAEAERKYGLPDPPKGKPAPPPPDPNSKAERERLKNLTAASAEALEYWAALVQHFPKSRHRETALFQAARIFADTQKWPDAVAMADKLAAEFPQSKSAPKLLYEIGTALAALQRWDDAVKIADRLATAYPKEPYAPKVLYEVASALLKVGKFKDTTDLAEKMIAAFPQDPNGPKLFYDLGVILYDMAEKGDPIKSEPLWKNAAFMLKRFCELCPKSPWAGDGIIRQTDIALERLFDLALARVKGQQGVNWAKDANENPQRKEAEHLPILAAGSSQSHPLSLKEATYGCYLRAGLVAYLGQEYDRATSMFKAADDVGCPRPYKVVQGTLPTGMERLVAAAKKGTPLTPPEVLKGDPKPALILGLGDLYFAAEHWEKARELYQVVYDQQVRPTSQLQNSWAAFMIARTYFWQFEFAKAQEFYHVVFEKYPQSPWAATALFYNATMAYSNLRDMKEAVACLDQIRKNYPKDEMSERATYLIGQLYQWRREFAKAKAAYAMYLENYPNGMYAKGIKETLLPELEKGRSGLEKTAKRGQ